MIIKFQMLKGSETVEEIDISGCRKIELTSRGNYRLVGHSWCNKEIVIRGSQRGQGPLQPPFYLRSADMTVVNESERQDVDGSKTECREGGEAPLNPLTRIQNRARNERGFSEAKLALGF